ncbi:MAG: hypothetical protein WC804_18040 [Sphingomonas sp.]|jgi:hypothetical protein|uniref:hypothetical protein n=1 Tax=Sphingomonas sp. TaxID=28214 RepID=UPI0035696D7A
MIRKILGVVAGIVIGYMIILAADALNQWLYPIPVDLDPSDDAAMSAYAFALPLPVRLIYVGGWFIGTFCGAWLSMRISDWRYGGWIIALLVIADGVLRNLQFAEPLWMEVAAILAPLLGAWLGARLHAKPYPGEPLLG